VKNKAQASVEYMVTLAISLLIFGAILFVAIGMITESGSQLGVDSAFKAVEEIKEAADFIYVHGHPSKIKINVHIPSNIENISIAGNLIKMSISTGQSYTDIYDIAKGNITADDAIDFMCSGGVCRGGTYVLNVESLETGYDVNITRG